MWRESKTGFSENITDQHTEILVISEVDEDLGDISLRDCPPILCMPFLKEKDTKPNTHKQIALYEYDKGTDDKKKETRRYYSGMEKKKVGDKYVADDGDYPESNITDAEKKLGGKFAEMLFDNITGKKAYNSYTKPAEQNDSPTTPNEKDGGILKHLGDNGYWYAGGIVLVAAVLGIVFGKNINEGGNGPKEEEGIKSEGDEDKEEEE